MTTVPIDIDDLIRILRLANRTELQRVGEDTRAFARACQSLLGAGMAPDEITRQIAPLSARMKVQP